MAESDNYSLRGSFSKRLVPKKTHIVEPSSTHSERKSSSIAARFPPSNSPSSSFSSTASSSISPASSSDRQSCTLTSAEFYLKKLISLDPHELMLTISMEMLKWKDMLDLEDSNVDKLPLEDLFAFVMRVIHPVLLPKTTVMKHRFRQWIRTFFGSKFLGNRLPKLIMGLEDLIFLWREMHRITLRDKLAADIASKEANLQDRKRAKLIKIKKYYHDLQKKQGSSGRHKAENRASYEKKKQQLVESYDDLILRLKDELAERRERTEYEPLPHHEGLANLFTFFNLLLDHASPSVDASSMSVIHLFSQALSQRVRSMVSETMAESASLLEKRMGQLITSKGAKSLTAYYEDRRRGGTRTDLEVEVRTPTHLDPEAMALAMVPRLDQLREPCRRYIYHLPENIIDRPYSSADEYWTRQFFLLQADCFMGMQADIQWLQIFARERDEEQAQDLQQLSNLPVFVPGSKYYCNIYVDCEVRAFAMLDIGENVAYAISFKLYNPSHNSLTLEPHHAPIDWTRSNKLTRGRLVALSFDKFQSTVFWAHIAAHDVLLVANGLTLVSFLDNGKSFLSALSARRSCEGLVMVEGEMLFAAYSCTLGSLLALRNSNMPFEDEFVFLKNSRELPEYIRSLPTETVSRIQDEALHAVVLDETQQAAVTLALTQRVALIQGPPGTGKTFCGLRIVHMLFKFKQEAERVRINELQMRSLTNTTRPFSLEEESVGGGGAGPILVLTYKNHALDQFLTGCLNVTTNIVRVGSRSKSIQLEKYNLKTLYKQVSAKTHLRARFDTVHGVKLLKNEIGYCVYILNELLLTQNLPYLLSEMRAELTAAVFFANTDQLQQDLFLDNSSTISTISRSAFDALSLDAQIEMLIDMWIPLGPREEPRNPPRPDPILGPAPKEVRGASNNNNSNSSGSNSLNGAGELEDIEPRTILGQCDLPVDLPSFKRVFEGEERRMDEASEDIGLDMQNLRVSHLNKLRFPKKRDRNALDGLKQQANLWKMNLSDRVRVAKAWIWEAILLRHTRMVELHSQLTADYRQLREDMYLNVLKKADIVGMTTTGAANYHQLLLALRPSIVIVEEAAEIIESQLIACLSNLTRHLILIGDHKQLQPSITCYPLEHNKSLNISLFERLISNDFPHQTLGIQRRMHPNIARCVTSIYPHLRNHQILDTRTFQLHKPTPQVMFGGCEIPGMDKNLFFWNHHQLEVTSLSGFSVTNPHEVSMIALLAHCLLSQGVQPYRITVLTTYKGQLMVLRRVLKELARKFSRLWETNVDPIDVLTVDMYQGDENDIILLSLVRSNNDRKIGFLSRPNRYCVALSRARHGLYVCGNLSMLATNNEYWSGLVNDLGDCVSSELVIRCPQHPQNGVVLNANQDLSGYGEMMVWNGQGLCLEHSERDCHTSTYTIQAENSRRIIIQQDTLEEANRIDSRFPARVADFSPSDQTFHRNFLDHAAYA